MKSLFARRLNAKLASIFGKMRIVDLGFPQLPFYWFNHEVITALSDISCESEAKFYTRFKQWGGSIPLFPIERLGEHLPSIGSDRAVLQIAAMPATRVRNIAKDISRDWVGTLLLIYGSGREMFAADVLNGWQTCLCFEDTLSEEWAILFATGNDIDPTLALVANVPADPSMRGNHLNSLAICLDCSVDEKAPISITADRFIHDGRRKSESSGDYSWLWIGEEMNIRLFVGCIPSPYSKIRLIVPKAFTSAALLTSKIMLNGVEVSSSVEVWSEGAGAITFDARDGDDGIVVGFSVPVCSLAEDGQTRLSACIDRIELLS